MLLVHDREDPGHARQFDCCDVILETCGMPNGPACFPSSLLIILQSRCRLMALVRVGTIPRPLVIPLLHHMYRGTYLVRPLSRRRAPPKFVVPPRGMHGAIGPEQHSSFIPIDFIRPKSRTLFYPTFTTTSTFHFPRAGNQPTNRRPIEASKVAVPASACSGPFCAACRSLSHFVSMGAVETLAYLSILYHPVILLAAPALSVDTSQVLLHFCWPCLLISELR